MKNIAVVGDPSRAMIREIFEGVLRFSREVEPYGTRIITELPEALQAAEKGWLQAIVGSLYEEWSQVACLESGIPVVNISDRSRIHRLPAVLSDNLAIGEMAAEYYLKMGFEHFLYYCENTHFSDMRFNGFSRVLEAAGFQSGIVKTKWADEEVEVITQIIRETPGHLAIFAAGDNLASRLVIRLQQKGLEPPQDYAILGVNNDHQYNNFCFTKISSVDPNYNLQGYHAAACIHAQFTGDAHQELTRISPLMVVTKNTTELRYDDELLNEALEYIRQHAFTGLTTEMLIDHLNCSRRSIETRFKTHMKTSITQYIIQMQMDEAGRRLKASKTPIGQIAYAVGYKDQRYFAKVFKKYHDLTPTQYREA